LEWFVPNTDPDATMTPTLPIADTTPVAATTTKAADDLLRDLAVVLKLTRRVRDEMLAAVPVRTAARAAAPRRELATA
jgi:hypothetical protein